MDQYCRVKIARVIFFLVLGTCSLTLNAQQRVTTFGFQFKPMVPSKFFGNGTENAEIPEFTAEFKPRFGLNYGMIVRKGLSRNWSIETGICFVQRNFTLSFQNTDLEETPKIDFRYICYEIPLQGMVFVKLGERLFMNASGGVSLDLYPSNVESTTSASRDTVFYDFYQKTWKTNWIQFALLANYGFEWRTPSSGYFYLGVSYHRPFREIGTSVVRMERDGDPSSAYVFLKGNYLTADLRYFFHENPERRKPKS